MRTFLIAIALIAGCDSPDSSPMDAPIDADLSDASPVASISVAPTTATIATGGTVQLVVTGKRADDSTIDLTFRAAFVAMPESIATVSGGFGSGGLVTGQGPGAATIAVSVPEGYATVSITVMP